MIFTIVITYSKPMDEIEKATEAHRAYLRKLHEAGKLVASGPFQPRTGGMLLLEVDDREKAMAVVQGDPFHRQGLAEYEVREWKPVIGAERITARG